MRGNLRSQRCFTPIRRALGEVAKREGVRVVHFSVQHNHVHLGRLGGQSSSAKLSRARASRAVFLAVRRGALFARVVACFALS
jgi:hypothetical protein